MRITGLFHAHPDHPIVTSFPGLAAITGARILAELGDDRERFATGRGLKACAGCAPIPKASSKTITVSHRVIKSRRLAAANTLRAARSRR